MFILSVYFFTIFWPRDAEMYFLYGSLPGRDSIPPPNPWTSLRGALWDVRGGIESQVRRGGIEGALGPS